MIGDMHWRARTQELVRVKLSAWREKVRRTHSRPRWTGSADTH